MFAADVPKKRKARTTFIEDEDIGCHQHDAVVKVIERSGWSLQDAAI
jgi:hypothetical protein